MFPEGRALEFLLAAVIALVVVGPKDLPILMRKLGQAVGRMRAMAAEFRASFDEMARQSELDELRKEVEAMRRAQFADVAGEAGKAEVHDVFSGLQQDLNEVAADLRGAPPAWNASTPQATAPPQETAAAALDPASQPQAAAAASLDPAPKPRARRKAPAKAEGEAAATPAKPRTRKKAEPKA